LTTLFSSTTIPTVTAIDTPVPRKKRGWLPLLTVLFLISYGLMTMLIVEQGSTIESQRVLIRELFRDSAELSASKIKALREKNAANSGSQTPLAKTQPPVTQTPSTQTPSTQAQSPQNPSTQAQNQPPSSQAAPKHRLQNPAGATPYQMPARPAVELGDARRVLVTI